MTASARRWTVGALLAVALAACARGDGDVTTRVAGLLADLEGDAPTSTRAAAALAALGPGDAAAVPALLAAITCPPPAAADHDHHGHGHGPHGDHRSDAGHADHGACNDHVVIAVAAGLGAIGGAAVDPLLAVLRTGDDINRTFAGYALARMHPSAAPALVAALDDPDPRLRIAVIGAVRSMAPPPADTLPAIAARLHDDDPEVRTQAADTLGHFGAAAVTTILTAFDDRAPRVRASAASALRLIGPPARPAAPQLTLRLADADATVRVNAAAALAAVGATEPDAIRALVGALTDPDHTVRWSAALALGRLGPAAVDAAPALQRAVNDPHALVRTAAGDALRLVRAQPGGG